MQNFRLMLCYDGSRYRGWQKQGNTSDTIQGKLEELLSRILGQPTELAGSGRTDAGVHALKQVCSFRAETEMNCSEILEALRRFLPEDIGAVSLEEAGPRFHARLSCREKAYVYSIWNSASPNVFLRRYMLSLPEKLNLAEMRKAADVLEGRHDFAAFCSNRHIKKSTVRELRSIELIPDGEALYIRFTADGFLYNMVRILTGTLIEVGLGKRDASGISGLLSVRDRSLAGFTAPAHGLTLTDVRY